ncbi:unnamed protein product, partial [Iphiclides podalirius]
MRSRPKASRRQRTVSRGSDAFCPGAVCARARHQPRSPCDRVTAYRLQVHCAAALLAITFQRRHCRADKPVPRQCGKPKSRSSADSKKKNRSS